MHQFIPGFPYKSSIETKFRDCKVSDAIKNSAGKESKISKYCPLKICTPLKNRTMKIRPRTKLSTDKVCSSFAKHCPGKVHRVLEHRPIEQGCINKFGTMEINFPTKDVFYKIAICTKNRAREICPITQIHFIEINRGGLEINFREVSNVLESIETYFPNRAFITPSIPSYRTTTSKRQTLIPRDVLRVGNRGRVPVAVVSPWFSHGGSSHSP